MAWYSKLLQKLNPAQSEIASDAGHSVATDVDLAYVRAFDKIESLNRGTSLVVNAAASLDYDIKEKVLEGKAIGIRTTKLYKLLNYAPNPHQSIQDFRSNIFTDFILEGNVFLYFDGVFLYHLPAAQVEIIPDPKTFVKEYIYNSVTRFGPDEIIHFKDLSNSSIYRGTSRLSSAADSISVIYKMQQFQANFFENGAVPGMVFTTENTLSQAAKERTISYWVQKYNPRTGSRRPMIVDSGLKPVPIADINFKEMDFDLSIKTHNYKILSALGVPPTLLDGGNNANISPNLRLFYLETVMPIVRKFTSAIERYFGYDVEPITTSVSALQPELKDQASFLTSLVNGGVITPNEARTELRYEKLDKLDEIRIPQNIAGSAVNPGVGGAPKKPKPEEA